MLIIYLQHRGVLLCWGRLSSLSRLVLEQINLPCKKTQPLSRCQKSKPLTLWSKRLNVSISWFLLRDAMLALYAVIVYLSVTLQLCIKTAKLRITQCVRGDESVPHGPCWSDEAFLDSAVRRSPVRGGGTQNSILEIAGPIWILIRRTPINHPIRRLAPRGHRSGIGSVYRYALRYADVPEYVHEI